MQLFIVSPLHSEGLDNSSVHPRSAQYVRAPKKQFPISYSPHRPVPAAAPLRDAQIPAAPPPRPLAGRAYPATDPPAATRAGAPWKQEFTDHEERKERKEGNLGKDCSRDHGPRGMDDGGRLGQAGSPDPSS